MAKAAKKKAVAKRYKYRYFVINIKIRTVKSKRDLPPSEYSRIFKEFYQSYISAQSARQKLCALITQGERQMETEKVFIGQIAQFTNVNNKKWFNKKKKEIDPKFKVPTEYAANAAITEYLFIPSIHRFVYLIKSSEYIQPYSIKKYFINAFDEHLSDGYVVNIDVETDLTTIGRIFEASNLVRLDVKINYSNNDFTKEMQEFVEEDMKASNVGELHISAAQKEGNPIDISKSEILSGALESSGSNGEATATIIDANGKRTKINTSSNPLKITIQSTEQEKFTTLYNDIKDEFRQK